MGLARSKAPWQGSWCRLVSPGAGSGWATGQRESVGACLSIAGWWQSVTGERLALVSGRVDWHIVWVRARRRGTASGVDLGLTGECERALCGRLNALLGC